MSAEEASGKGAEGSRTLQRRQEGGFLMHCPAKRSEHRRGKTSVGAPFFAGAARHHVPSATAITARQEAKRPTQ